MKHILLSPLLLCGISVYAGVPYVVNSGGSATNLTMRGTATITGASGNDGDLGLFDSANGIFSHITGTDGGVVIGSGAGLGDFSARYGIFATTNVINSAGSRFNGVGFTNGTVTGAFTGNGSGLTNLQASAIAGVLTNGQSTVVGVSNTWTFNPAAGSNQFVHLTLSPTVQPSSNDLFGIYSVGHVNPWSTRSNWVVFLGQNPDRFGSTTAGMANWVFENHYVPSNGAQPQFENYFEYADTNGNRTRPIMFVMPKNSYAGVNTLFNGQYYFYDYTNGPNATLLLYGKQLIGPLGAGFTGAKLDIRQDANEAQYGLRIVNSGTTRAGYFWVDALATPTARLSSSSDESGPIVLNGAGTGNVGIKTTTPAATLDINGTVSVSGIQTNLSSVLLSGDNRLYWRQLTGEFTYSPQAGRIYFLNRGDYDFYADANNNDGVAQEFKWHTGEDDGATAKIRMAMWNSGGLGLGLNSAAADPGANNLNIEGKVSAATITITNSPTFRTTNAAPANVTVGTTAPDTWILFTNASGQTYKLPAWAEH